VKVWWVQAESMLALWKLHQYYGLGEGAAGPAAAGQGSRADAAAGGRLRYLRVLAKTAAFVREHSTDTAGGGEMFWQVRMVNWGVWREGGGEGRLASSADWERESSNSSSRALLSLRRCRWCGSV
jgi:hypothetical protein